jgi:hypothetical protein
MDVRSVMQSYYAEITVDDHETDHEEKELTPVQASEDRSSLLMDNGSCGTISQNSVCLKTRNKSMSPPHLSYLKFGTKVLHTSPA